MAMETLSLELELDVGFCCVEDACGLELVVLVTTDELVLPPNWVNAVTERMAITMARTTKVDRFLVRLLMACFLSKLSHPSRKQVRGFKSRIMLPSIAVWPHWA
jgi:hypothetical protein